MHPAPALKRDFLLDSGSLMQAARQMSPITQRFCDNLHVGSPASHSYDQTSWSGSQEAAQLAVSSLKCMVYAFRIRKLAEATAAAFAYGTSGFQLGIISTCEAETDGSDDIGSIPVLAKQAVAAQQAAALRVASTAPSEYPVADFIEPTELTWNASFFAAEKAVKEYLKDSHADY